MRLELLCEMELIYRQVELLGGQFVLLRPYGTEEGSGYGEGEGTIMGTRINGTMRWINHPRRRGDAVTLPDAHGIIRTEDDAFIMFSLQGRTVFIESGGVQLLNVIFEAEDERYRWLNNTLCVLEGFIRTEGMQARVYMCVNEMLGQAD